MIILKTLFYLLLKNTKWSFTTYTIFIVLSQFIKELVNFHLGSDMYNWMWGAK